METKKKLFLIGLLVFFISFSTTSIAFGAEGETDTIKQPPAFSVEVIEVDMQVVSDSIKPKGLTKEVPMGNTEFKAYMDWRAITDYSSPQYQIQQEAYTDENGFRRLENGDYLVAMGTYYSSYCGARFLIILDTGQEFYVTIGDIKADIHTNLTKQYRETGAGKNVVEFIVHTDNIPSLARQMGDMSFAGFEGHIEEIIEIV